MKNFLKLLTLLIFILFSSCAEKKVTVSKENRKTLTTSSNIDISKDEIKTALGLPVAEIIKNGYPNQSTNYKINANSIPTSYKINAQQTNLATDGQIVYCFAKKGILRFDITQKKFLDPLKIKLDQNLEALLLAANKHLLCLLTLDGTIRVYNTALNKELWNKSLKTFTRSKPLIENNKLYIQTVQNRLFCFDLKSGKELWNYRAQPAFVAVGKGSLPLITKKFIITGLTSGDVSVLDKENGMLLWNDTLINNQGVISTAITHVVAQPLVSDDILYAHSYANNLSAYHLNTGELLWTKNIGGIHTALLVGNYIYVINNQSLLIALNRKTGAVRWTTDLTEELKNPQGFTTPIMANNQIVFSTSQGTTVFINPHDGSIDKTIDLKDKSWPQDMLVINGNLVLLTDKLHVFY